MFHSEHQCKNLFLGAFVGGTLGIILATLLFTTDEGKRLQKVFMHKMHDMKDTKDEVMAKGKKILKARNKIRKQIKREVKHRIKKRRR
ncbi:MAG TPA: YtxH domain-containing protein [Rhabdochlamydiaceae bacterium]|nr:YtxH domain-containing protein [Rhabdochlamydiaceae bacterium]